MALSTNSISRTAYLAGRIHQNTVLIELYLSRNCLPSISLDVHAHFDPSLPPDLEAARQEILDATIELNELMSSPREHLYSIAHGANTLCSLHAVYHFRIARAFSPGEEIAFGELAGICGLNEGDLRRLLRLAMSYGIFCETSKGVVAHTATSRLLAEDSGIEDWLGALCEDIWPAAVQTIPAMAKWPNSQEPEHSGYSLSHGTGLSMYLDFERDPKRSRRFARSMKEYTTGPGFNFDYVLQGFDWGTLGDAVVVDIGGSHGEMMSALSQKFPRLTCYVEDLPAVIDSRENTGLKVNERITFLHHDFFTEQPIKGADVYFFRWVLHNWSDKYCQIILKQLIPALKHGARVLINDFCLPEPNVLPKMLERRVRVMDVAQLNIQNSRERDLDEYLELFATVDSRLKFERIIQPEGSVLSILEAKWYE